MSLRSEVVRIVNELLANSKKITELTTASSIVGDELVEVVQDGVNKKVAVSNIGGGGGTAYWRGSYDLSVNAYPSSGGSGTAGAIQSGDEWYVSVGGDLDVTGLGVITINPGAIIKSLVDTPGSTPGNWRVIQ